MTHPDIENLSPFAFAPLCAAGESGRPLLMCIVKATFEITEAGALRVSEEQLGINFAGECRGDPATASYKYEPEVAWAKVDTDVVLIGHAWAPSARTRTLDVGFRVGSVHQIGRVFGERAWHAAGRLTPPQPFERIPLIYERAYGGADRSMQQSERLAFEPHNPLGSGYYQKGQPEDGDLLPNIEDPRHLIGSYRDRPKPVGFGFTSPNFQPRLSYGGTYDQDWRETRSPFLPPDFDRRFFNAAPPALVVPGRLRGGERVVLHHVSSKPELSFTLPGPMAPRCQISRRHGPDATLMPELDTVIVNTDDGVLVLVWRAALELWTGPQDVRSLHVSVGEMPALKAGPGARLAGVAA